MKYTQIFGKYTRIRIDIASFWWYGEGASGAMRIAQPFS